MLDLLYYLYFFGAGWALVDIIKDLKRIYRSEDVKEEDTVVVIALSLIYIIGGMATSWLYVYVRRIFKKESGE